MKLILWQPETLAAIAADNKYEYCVSHFRFEFAFLLCPSFLFSSASSILFQFQFRHLTSNNISTPSPA